jgi:hypothetical protein
MTPARIDCMTPARIDCMTPARIEAVASAPQCRVFGCLLLRPSRTRRIAPFFTQVSAAVVSIDWTARRAHVALISPLASSGSGRDVGAVPDVSAAFPVGARATSRFDDALRQRCTMRGAGALQLHAPYVCGATALAALVMCCCAAAVAVVWVGVAAARTLFLKQGGTKWERRPFKDRHEKL